jgi:lipopolysaccharide assembly outer membrane protein LptD (OstA)
VEVSADARFTRFRGISQATLYRDGTPALRLRAREIVLDRRTEDLTALGDIEIVSEQGDRMLASEARWSAAQRTLTFPRGVEIRIGRHRVRADRLVVDLALEVLELEGDVDVTFTVDEPPPELRGSP